MSFVQIYVSVAKNSTRRQKNDTIGVDKQNRVGAARRWKGAVMGMELAKERADFLAGRSFTAWRWRGGRFAPGAAGAVFRV